MSTDPTPFRMQLPPWPQVDFAGGIDWRLMLPLSLSYDHRVINGADAARFTVAIAGTLAEPSALAILEPV